MTPNTSPEYQGRRKFIALLGGVISVFFVGDRALAAKKPAPKKAVKKSPKKPPAKPTPKASPTPRSTQATTPTPSPTPAKSQAASLPSAKSPLIVAGKNLTTSDLAIGATVLGTFIKDGIKTSALVTRLEERSFVALKPVCTHAGGPVEITSGSLICYWHNSRFNQRNGAVINGPATEPLENFNIELVDDALFVLA